MNHTDWALEILRNTNKVAIEGYAMGAKGKVFHIAESTGSLKTGLFLLGKETRTFSPSRIKKYATDKGNANKEAMFDAFTAETGVDLKEILTPKRSTLGNPVTDIIDAYYICRMLLDDEQSDQPLIVRPTHSDD